MRILYYIFIFIFGLMFGSFFACISYRIPNKISTITPSSFCPVCRTKLKWYHNIPLFSFIFLKGKCAFCKDKISLMYPLTELSTGILYLLAFLVFGFSYNFLITIVIESVFIITFLTDIKYYYISDRVIFTGTVLILLLNIVFNSFGVFIYKILSSISIFSIMYSIKLIGDKLFKKESLGGGDIKLMLFVGSSIGLIPSLFSLFFASVFGLIYYYAGKGKEGIIPFGPFILLATLIIWYISQDNNFIFNFIFS